MLLKKLFSMVHNQFNLLEKKMPTNTVLAFCRFAVKLTLFKNTAAKKRAFKWKAECAIKELQTCINPDKENELLQCDLHETEVGSDHVVFIH